MEKIDNNKELLKKRRRRPHKNTQEIAQTLENSGNRIPNWKVFNIKEIADIDLWSNKIINLKNVKTNKNWEKYIIIDWRKYYEFDQEREPKDSIYVIKWNSLFIWDRFEWLTNRDGISFRYSRWIWENISFEQRKTKYAWWAMHLKEMYKSENLSISEVVTIIRYKWKPIKVTKNMLDQYLKWWLNKAEKNIVEIVIWTDPNVFAYLQELKE